MLCRYIILEHIRDDQKPIGINVPVVPLEHKVINRVVLAESFSDEFGIVLAELVIRDIEDHKLGVGGNEF